MLKVAVQRNQEQEESITDLQNALLRLKSQFQESAYEKEKAKQDYSSRKDQLERELNDTQEQLN